VRGIVQSYGNIYILMAAVMGAFSLLGYVIELLLFY